MEKRKVSKKISPNLLWFVVAVINIIVMITMLEVTSGKALDWMTYDERMFGDLKGHIYRLLYLDSVYGNEGDVNAIYPPFASLFISFFSNIMKFKASDGDSALWQSVFTYLIVTMFFVLFTIGLVELCMYFYKGKKKYIQLFLPFYLILSYPFWALSFGTGNPVIYSMLFLLGAIALKDSESTAGRELALIFIAISASLKLYPACFGILWLVEKRYREAVRMIIYGIVFSVLPFAFYGGFSAITKYAYSFMAYTGKGGHSISSIVGDFELIFGEKGVLIGYLFSICIIACIILFLVIDKVNWKTVTLLTCILTIMLPESYMYNFVYIAIPQIMFLNEMDGKETYCRLDYVYAILFVLTLTCPPLIFRHGGGLIGMYVSWLILLAIVFGDEMNNVLKLFRKKELLLRG